MIEVKINHELVDIFRSEDFDLALKREVFNTDDITKRGGLHTYRFKLPRSTKNNQILDFRFMQDRRDRFFTGKEYEIDIVATDSVSLASSYSSPCHISL